MLLQFDFGVAREKLVQFGFWAREASNPPSDTLLLSHWPKSYQLLSSHTIRLSRRKMTRET